MTLRDHTPRTTAFILSALACALSVLPAQAQTPPPPPTLTDARLAVRAAVTGLQTPTTMAFLGPDDMFVLEKATGRVQRVRGGAVTSTVLDLAVNAASERGLLGIALHPRFPRSPWVYLFWSCVAPVPTDPFIPSQRTCTESEMLGADSTAILATPLLGNRVDRFVWNGSTLTFDRNIVQLRSFQNDGGPEPPDQGDLGQPARGNHNGGVIRFGPDGKLYIQVGDTGRRGWMQNLVCGPTADCPGRVMRDDQFGGPAPDDAHLTGVILRLNDDGSTPASNPFYFIGRLLPGHVGDNIQKLYAYGLRNGFGMAFDPVSGDLWEQENGDDSFSELNRVTGGFNSGWIQVMGPLARLPEYREIENSPTFFGLQQLRWPPPNIAETSQAAFRRLFRLPGSRYSSPEMAWKFEVAPGGIGFVKGRGLGSEFQNDLFMGGAVPVLQGGHLFRFNLTRDRKAIAVSDARLDDRVADNAFKYDITESESLLIGSGFGAVTDIQTGPNGNLFLVSLTHGTVYEIHRQP
jgi:glucose/arabinose dehydrogenase